MKKNVRYFSHRKKRTKRNLKTMMMMQKRKARLAEVS